MNLAINGKQVETAENMTVTELLQDQKVKMPEMVSVELNGSILERQSFESTQLKDGDSLEFLYFMGGGSGLN